MVFEGYTSGIIFDNDGVFVDSLKCIYGAYNYMFNKIGRPQISFEEFELFHTIDFYDNFYKLGLHDRTEEVSIHLQKYIDEHYHESPFFWEMIEVVKGLDQKIGMATTAKSDAIKEKFKGTGLLDKMEIIIGRDMVNNIKPHPEPVLKCAHALNLPLEQLAYVGDTCIDIIAARAAGIPRIIAVTWGYEDVDKLARMKPDVILLKPYELKLFL